MSKTDLKIDWATHEAAKYACENWHYSGCVPAGKTVKLGVWESGTFIGCVVFGMGSGNSTNGSKYGLDKFGQVAELCRVALNRHENTVTRIISVATKFLNTQSPKLRMLISFADPENGHHGGIYQGGNWIYAGKTAKDYEVCVGGRWMHHRTATSKVSEAGNKYKKRILEGKHRYLMPLDAEMRKQILPLSKPYPKRATSDTVDTSGFQPEEGGSIPTVALHSTKEVTNDITD